MLASPIRMHILVLVVVLGWAIAPALCAQGAPDLRVVDPQEGAARNALPYIACPVRFNFEPFTARNEALPHGIVRDSLGRELQRFPIPYPHFGFILTDRCDWNPLPNLRLEVYEGDRLRQTVMRSNN